jgi:hypothetical protein
LQQGGVEYKRRDLKEKTIVPLDKIVKLIKVELASLEAEIAETVVPVPFKD